MNKPLRSVSWLLVPILASACSTAPAPAVNNDTSVSPWKAVPNHAVETDGDRTLPAPMLPSGPRTEFFGSSSPAPQSKPASQGAASGRPGDGYELNFHDADIRGVIDTVLGDMLKLDYVIAPAVQGRITFRTSRPVAKSSLLPALEAALSSVSAAIVQSDQTVHVMPMADAPQRMRGAQRVTNMAPPPPDLLSRSCRCGMSMPTR